MLKDTRGVTLETVVSQMKITGVVRHVGCLLCLLFVVRCVCSFVKLISFVLKTALYRKVPLHIVKSYNMITGHELLESILHRSSFLI